MRTILLSFALATALLAQESLISGIVQDSSRQSFCAVVAKTNVSRPRLSGKVTICRSGVGPHHLVKASMLGTDNFALSTTLRYDTSPVNSGYSGPSRAVRVGE